MKPALATSFTLALSLAAPAAWAQNNGLDATLRRGVALREAGDERAAYELFRSAWERTHSPHALAQMGLVEHALGRWTEADAHLREALASADPWVQRNREALQGALAIVARNVDAQRPPTAPAVVAPPPPTTAPAPVLAPPRPDASLTHASPLPTLGWVAASGAAAALLSSGMIFLLRESVVSEFNDGPCVGTARPYAQDTPECQSDRDRADTLGALSVGFTAVGAGLAVTAAALFVAAPGPRATTALRCVGGPGALGLSCGVRF